MVTFAPPMMKYCNVVVISKSVRKVKVVFAARVSGHEGVVVVDPSK